MNLYHITITLLLLFTATNSQVTTEFCGKGGIDSECSGIYGQSKFTIDGIPPPPGDLSDKIMDAPDLLLDIPKVAIDDLSLQVSDLKADVALKAGVANLLQLNAGLNFAINDVNLNISGVQATAKLVVRLDNVRGMVNQAFDTINQNPQVLESVLNSLNNTQNSS